MFLRVRRLFLLSVIGIFGLTGWIYFGETSWRSLIFVPLPNSRKEAEIHRADPYVSSSFVLDSSGSYKIFPSIIRAENFQARPVLTLVSHCTAKNLPFLVELAERWRAPLSIAVFTESELMESLLLILEGFRKCDRFVSDWVTFHVVSPLVSDSKHHERRQDDFLTNKLSGVCNGSLPEEFNELMKSGNSKRQNYEESTPYPNNLLRNVARRFCQSQFVLTVDIDLVPSANLYEQFVFFVNSRNYSFFNVPVNEVFVIPVFEMKNGILEIPKQKSELVKLFHRLDVRPFYFEVCWPCQQPTDYSRWENAKIKKDENGNDLLDVAFEVEWRNPWEPFFIAHNRVPWFDERFKQYGFNRISQICELYVAGYKFSVLNIPFLVHRSFKRPNSFHASKAEEHSHNKQLYSAFKTEIHTRYPSSSRFC